MIKLMRLELKKFNIRPYLIATCISFLIILISGFTFPLIGKATNDPTFLAYDNIFRTMILFLFMFLCIQSVAMASKFVIEEYNGKKKYILHTYPVDRKKVLMAKSILISTYSLLSFVVSGALFVTVYSFVAPLLKVVQGTVDASLIYNTAVNSIPLAVIISVFFLVPVLVGFKKSSVPAVFVTSITLIILIGNTIGIANTFIVSAILGAVVFVVSSLCNVIILNIVHKEEV